MNESNDTDGTEAGDIDEGYQAPESDSSVVSDDELLSDFVGPNNAYYFVDAFKRFAAGGSVKWNWPAFFVTFPWLLYRKMWLYAFLYMIVIPLVFSIALLFIFMSVLSGGGAYNGMASVIRFGQQLIAPIALLVLLYFVFAFVLTPLFATRLYYGHARKKVGHIKARTHSAEYQRLEIARAGSTSIIGALVAVFIMFGPSVVGIGGAISAVSIPSYQGYSVRAQVTEGLNLSGGAKAAVSEYFQDRGEFPSDNASAGLSSAETIRGKYVSSVHVDAGTITVTYGNDADQALRGRTMVLRPESQGDYVSWTCTSRDIAPEHRPAACQ